MDLDWILQRDEVKGHHKIEKRVADEVEDLEESGACYCYLY